MRILITGGTGFVGTNLVKALYRDHDVCIITRSLRKVDNLRLLGIDPSEIVIEFGDITDQFFTYIAAKKFRAELVIHLAAEPIVRRCLEDPYPCIVINTLGTANVLETCRVLGVPAIIFSTDKVYGEGTHKVEAAPLNPKEIYGATKAAADILARTYRKVYSLPVAVLRPCNIYGPGDTNPRIIPNTIRKCLMGEQPIIYRGYRGTREYIYVEDLVSAVIHIMKLLPDLVREEDDLVFNIGTGEMKTQEEVVQEILKHFPDIEPRYIDPPPELMKEIEEQSVDSTKIRSLGWRPRTSFTEGIEKTVKWWRDNWEVLGHIDF